MAKAIGYVRVSTEEQAREGISLENQHTKIRAYCELNDLELTEVLEDAGKSGKDLNRAGLQDLLEKMKRRDIDALVVYKLDRLSRRVVDTLRLMELIEKRRVTFHSITEKVDTRTAMGKFFLNMMASLNQMERDLISERTRDALRLKIVKNERAGQVPYGWRLAPDGKTLLANVREQKAIALVKDLHGKGYSFRAICHELEKEGYESVGRAWHPQTVKNILRRAV
jgi:DNA invertase Pin-like site-specific DNA recombinase